MANDSPNSDKATGSEVSTKPHVFKVQIDKLFFDIPEPVPTGRYLLQEAGKTPPEQFALYQKVKGGQPKRIALDERVDLRELGTERFVTLPLDQTEGSI